MGVFLRLPHLVEAVQQEVNSSHQFKTSACLYGVYKERNIGRKVENLRRA